MSGVTKIFSDYLLKVLLFVCIYRGVAEVIIYCYKKIRVKPESSEDSVCTFSEEVEPEPGPSAGIDGCPAPSPTNCCIQTSCSLVATPSNSTPSNSTPSNATPSNTTTPTNTTRRHTIPANTTTTTNTVETPKRDVKKPKPPTPHPNSPRTRKYLQYLLAKDNCTANKTLFEDAEFPAIEGSLYYSKRPDEQFEWLRPKEIVAKPVFFGPDSPTRFNVIQGQLGNCWLVAAIASMAMYPQLIYRVVSEDQSFDKQYAGIFHFQFWRYGVWIDVIVDDRLPCVNKQLVFARSANRNEFWFALLEKAYAKIHGSYEVLDGGNMCDAIVDLTGGVTEEYMIRESKYSVDQLYRMLAKADETQSLIGCMMIGSTDQLEQRTSKGLIFSHFYSVTKLYQIVVEKSNNELYAERIIRLRNPWGGEHEWTGPWSDGSPEWRHVSNEQKKEIDLAFHHDGEFWMSFEDFLKHFDRFEIVTMTPDGFERSNKIPWIYDTHAGEWVPGATAGGNLFQPTFWQNPQYRVTLKHVDPEDPSERCLLYVALMQKYRRAMRKFGKRYLMIGFYIYYLPTEFQDISPTPRSFFDRKTHVSKHFNRFLRECTLRILLPPGTYLIVPCTYDANEDAQFLLRVFSTSDVSMNENDRRLSIVAPIGMAGPHLHDRALEKVQEIEQTFNKFKEPELGWTNIKEVMDDYAKSVPNFDGFSKETVRSAIAMVDENRNGRIDIHEFEVLLTRLDTWKHLFEEADTEKTGRLPPFKLYDIMESLGFQVNRAVLNMLEHRYGKEDGSFQFDDYIMCVIKVTTLFDTYNRQAEIKDLSGFELVEWLEATIFS